MGDIGTITTGSTPSTSIPDYYSDDGIIWVTPTDIIENITFESARKLSELGQQVGRVVPKNTILITCIASIGKNTMLVNTGSFNQQINGLTPNENKYEPYFLLTESELWSAQMKKSAAAGTMQIINRTEFSGLETWIPTLNEQKVIGTYFRSLDNLITLHQRKLEKLKTFKKAMLDKMFPKNGELVPEIRFSGFTDPWEQRKLGEVSESYSGGTPSVGIKEYYSGQIPFIRSAEINSEMTELFLSKKGLKNSSARLVNIGDILYALYGATSGEVGRAKLKGAINQAILAIRPHTGYDSEFLAQWLRKSKRRIIETYIQGGQGNLSGTIVKELTVDFPSLKEQQSIGDFFSQLSNLITLHQRKLEKLQNIKKSMLNKMFI